MADVANWNVSPQWEPVKESAGNFVPFGSSDDTPRVTDQFADMSLEPTDGQQEAATGGTAGDQAGGHDEPFCRLCRGTGHTIAGCDVNHLFKSYNVTSELDSDEAWDALVAADEERDLDMIKEATFSYAKAVPGTTLESLEEAFRREGFNTHLIAKEQPISLAHTLVNFQGARDQKFVVTFQFSAKPRRLRQDGGWPSSPEENIERLAEAGFVVDSLVPVCRNCGEAGHTSKGCPQEKVESRAMFQIQCSLCDGIGHRARDCTAPRKQPGKPRECRICGSTDHLASDCTEKPARACRNCDSTEHESKECDQPKDWSRVTCNNCVAEGDAGNGGYDQDNGPDEAAAGDGGW
ncbi:hypothetical protein AMS68_000180 [Peltaster fructicola]|uniref:CCHC-type domain-containing protein n=1 Tax=Peltaster fructicola TaxID=286661 RepID=A0A6H0XIW0_9PEZI|nr:hypothetical protein AMS68_000180 [Peltaster fructicola]